MGRYKIYCVTDARWETEERNDAITACPVSGGHTVRAASASMMNCHCPKGGIYIYPENAIATAIAVMGTFYKIAGTTISHPEMDGFTHTVAGELKYVGDEDIVVDVDMRFSKLKGTLNDAALIALSIGSTIPAPTVAEQTIDTTKSEGESCVTHVEIVKNDIIKPVIANITAARNMTMGWFNIKVLRV